MTQDKIVSLKEIATFTSGGTPSKKNPAFYTNGTIPWITGADINDSRSISARTNVTEDAIAKSAATAMPAGTIALVTRTSVGKVGIFTQRTAFSQDITGITPGPEVDSTYLVHFLESQAHLLKRESRGATIKGVAREIVGNLPLALPSIAEQRRIASILDESDAIRAKRRSQLTHLDELPQALFDQIGGEQQQPVRLNEVATFTGGGTLPEGEPFSNQPEGTLLVKVSDMNHPGNSTFLQATSGWTEKKTPIGTTLDAGAVIFPKRGAAIATNKKRITTRQSALDPNVMGVSPDQKKLLTDYLFHWFQSFDLQSIASGSTVPQLNKKDLAPLSIPLPPLREQHAFAEKVTAIRAERDHVARALEADEELFAALQHRAFRGEL